jgi:hypothetical protein
MQTVNGLQCRKRRTLIFICNDKFNPLAARSNQVLYVLANYWREDRIYFTPKIGSVVLSNGRRQTVFQIHLASSGIQIFLDLQRKIIKPTELLYGYYKA